MPTAAILQLPSFGLRVRVPREINYSFENERKQHKIQMKEYRKVHFKEFWDTQTQAENLYLERFKKERIQKQKADMERHLTSVCTVSLHTKTKLANLEKRNENLLEKMRYKDIQ